ncbi:MAG: hydrogenase formation protein HypD [Sandaracinaceae bacterium]|nr:hydrogenase formation protein HypD [Sandaracinaceae bacterium]
MKWVEEFRAPEAIGRLAATIRAGASRRWTVMEICGGQTHTIARYGLDALVAEAVTLIHGPGCPVCVTPLEVLERARRLALTDGVVLHTFGDMLRVPGAGGDLLDARARGGAVSVIHSPLDAVRRAREDAAREHVLFAVGFETTAPSTAAAIEHAAALGLTNFAVLASHVRVPPAIEALLSSPDHAIDGLLAAGHVCTVEGCEDEYPALAARFGVPIVVTGFEPADLLHGLERCVARLEAGEAGVENAYARAVRPEGNPHARAAVARVFEVVDRPWRGLGVVAAGGLAIRARYAAFDAERRFAGLDPGPLAEPAACKAALVLSGRLSPLDCPELGRGCTPERPLGAPMVSSEGACAAYYRFRHTRGSPARA